MFIRLPLHFLLFHFAADLGNIYWYIYRPQKIELPYIYSCAF